MMHADRNGNSLDEFNEFDLGLDLRQPPKGPAEDGTPSTDVWYPEWCHDWGIMTIHLSASVLCATVRSRRPSALQDKLSRAQCKEELRTLLRFVANLASEYGLLRPVVGFVLLDACPGLEIHNIEGWEVDQDWHRGEFLLFVETDYDKYRERCLNLLRSAPGAWQQAEGQPPRKAVDILGSAITTASDDGARALLDVMRRSVDPDSGGDYGETENPLVASFYDWLAQEATAIDKRFSVSRPENASDRRSRRDEEGVPTSTAEPIFFRKTIARVMKLTVRNFRGFGSPGFELDLNADFLLLAGPNGLGKTSLIEALELLLTGYHHFRENPHHLFHKDEPEFELTAEVLLLDNERSTITCAGKREKKDEGWKNVSLEWSVVGENKKGWAMERPLTEEYRIYFDEGRLTTEIAWKTTELLARRTVVYPDRLENLFDDTTQGVTLRDYIEPIPPVVTDFLDGLAEKDSAIPQLEEWHQTLALERTTPNLPASRKQVLKALGELAKPYETLADLAQLPPLPRSDEVDGRSADNILSGWFEQLLQQLQQMTGRAADNLPEELPLILRNLHRAALEKAGRGEASTEEKTSALRELELRLRRCEAELGEIATEFPWLDEEVGAFDADGGQPDLLAVLETLRDHAGGWAEWKVEQQQAPQSLGLVLKELRRIRPMDAAKCAEELLGYLDPRKKAVKRRDQLEVQCAQLRAETARARRSKDAADLIAIRSELEETAHALGRAWSTEQRDRLAQSRAQEAEGKLKQIEALTERVQVAIDSIRKEERPSETLREEVQGLTNMVLSSVASSGGLRVELRPADDVDENVPSDASHYGLRRIYTTATDDGRARAVLSFGQRTQLGVAMVIAENRLLERKLGHRVFLMDDLSATYDLANLSRDAVFWRQMAYGNGARNESSHRQVFLSSHHEDLSNRLLDVMAPVEGRRALLYRFTGWELGTGPSVEVYEIEPQVTFDRGQERQEFRHWMRVQLTGTADADR